MNYVTLEKLFEESKYEELLSLYKEDLDNAEEYANLFINNSLISAIECQEALDVLTGLFMKFNTVFHIAEYEYEKKRVLFGKEDINTINCLRIKALFKAYMDNTKKAILTSQSQLKYWIHEMGLTK